MTEEAQTDENGILTDFVSQQESATPNLPQTRLWGKLELSGMTGSSARPLTDDWVATRATIIDCEQLLLGQENLSGESYRAPEYVVTFSYSVGGQTFMGTYRANSQEECGHAFEILYDPKHPHKNTGSDVLNKRWVRMIAAALGVLSVLVATWFWGKDNWFQW
jgi:hypothetical protein